MIEMEKGRENTSDKETTSFCPQFLNLHPGTGDTTAEKQNQLPSALESDRHGANPSLATFQVREATILISALVFSSEKWEKQTLSFRVEVRT